MQRHCSRLAGAQSSFLSVALAGLLEAISIDVSEMAQTLLKILSGLDPPLTFPSLQFP